MFNKIVNSKKQRYLPHDVNTRYHAVKLYLSVEDIRFQHLLLDVGICVLMERKNL